MRSRSRTIGVILFIFTWLFGVVVFLRVIPPMLSSNSLEEVRTQEEAKPLSSDKSGTPNERKQAPQQKHQAPHYEAPESKETLQKTENLDLKSQPLSSGKSQTGNVHAFYYPWYENPETDGHYTHWNHEVLPHWEDAVNKRYTEVGTSWDPSKDEIGAVFYPTLGTYSSGSEETIRQHFRWLLDSGVDVISSSWHRTGHERDKITDGKTPKLFEIAEEVGMKICFHLEPYKKRTADSVEVDIKKLIDKYGDSPAFYRTDDGLPLFYIYDSYQVPASKWKAIFDRSTGRLRGTKYDGLFIGLYLNEVSKQDILSGGFDGFYTYFASKGFTQGSNPEHWKELANWASYHGLTFIPSVGPGYDDVRVRPWNKVNVKSRDSGGYYDSMWSAASDAIKNSARRIVSITSFNEWHEGTQIEPARNNFRSKNGYLYQDYGDKDEEFYLEWTKHWVTAFRNITSEKE